MTPSSSKFLNPAHYLFIIFSCFFGSFVDSIQITPTNNPQVHTLSSEYNQTFEILNASSSIMLGSYYVSITAMSFDSTFHVVSNLRTCDNETKSSELDIEDLSYFEGKTIFSFHGNISLHYCFDVRILSDPEEKVEVDHTISVIFTPIENIFELDSSFEIELNKGVETTFTFNINNNFTSMLHINIKNNQKKMLNFNQNSSLLLKHSKGVCIRSQSLVLSSWLCDLTSIQEDTFRFSLQDISNQYGLYTLYLSRVEPQKVISNSQTTFCSFIPGFGSIYEIALLQIGLLEIKAVSNSHEELHMIGENTLNKLFKYLEQEKDNKLKEELSQKPLKIQNNKTSTQYLYFQGSDDNSGRCFKLQFCFIQQLMIDVESKAIYHIHLKKNVYQHLELLFNKANQGDIYEITLIAQKPNSLINLDLSPSDRSGMTYFDDLSKQQINFQKLNSSITFDSQNSSLYLTLHVNEDGLYFLKITKINVITGRDIISILFFICPLLFWTCLAFINFFYSRNHSNQQEAMNFPTIRIENSNVDNNTTTMTSSKTQMRDLDVEIDFGFYHANKCDEHAKQKSILNDFKAPTEENGSCDMKKYRCDICYETRKEIVVFLPCNHACACVFCSLKIIENSVKCPLCRKDIEDIQL